MKLAGEEVTIGAWTGPAIVNGGPQPRSATKGGVYRQSRFTISVNRSDLGDFVPEPQMTVKARGNEFLRIPDNGIVEYRDRFVITTAGKDVPA